MWYKICIALLLFSCARVNTSALSKPISLEITLLTAAQQEPYSFMKREFEKLFNIEQSSQIKCNLDVTISHRIQSSGITSTAFATNQTLIFTTFYIFKCNNDWKLENSIILTNEFTPQQEKTVGQYVGEKYFLQEISKQSAKEIYDEINLFIVLKTGV